MIRAQAEAIVCRAGWLARQPRDFQQRVLAVVEMRRFAAGDTVYAIGDPPDHILGLVEGELSVLLPYDDEPPTLVHLARPVWWTGEAAVMTETARRVSLVARKESWILRLDRPAIDRLVADDPDAWRRIAQLTVGHLDHALSVVAGLTMGNSRARVVTALCRLADLEGRTPSNSAVLSVSQQELGEMTRLTRNAVASVLKELEAAGLVSQRYRRVVIPSLSALLSKWE